MTFFSIIRVNDSFALIGILLYSAGSENQGGLPHRLPGISPKLLTFLFEAGMQSHPPAHETHLRVLCGSCVFQLRLGNSISR